MINKSIFSSAKQDWETPPELFKFFDEIFNFTLDPCANDINHKCQKYFTEEQNGLIQSWKGERVWVNPPYNRFQVKWIKKAYEECLLDPATIVVMLLPARTDTKIFHEIIFPYAHTYLLKGRIKFVGAKTSAPFPSMICVFGQSCREGINILDLKHIMRG